MTTGIIKVVDLETTGVKPPPDDSVCEIGWADLCPAYAGSCEFEIRHSGSCLVNPGRPIPCTASAIHHIIDSDVVVRATFDAIHPVILETGKFVNPAMPVVAYAAHSAKFERQFITDEITGGIPWICTYKCGLRHWLDAPSHSNQALRYFVNPNGLVREKAIPAHRAGPDAYVTAFLLRELLRIYPIETLIEWSSKPALQVTCHIGSYRGQKWEEVPDSMLSWIAAREFDEDVMFTVDHHLKRRRNEKYALRGRAADGISG